MIISLKNFISLYGEFSSFKITLTIRFFFFLEGRGYILNYTDYVCNNKTCCQQT